MKHLTFNNGLTIPQTGFGTAAIGAWQQNDSYVKDVILSAIRAGYRHLDTASVYGNERCVGEAVKESKIAREEFFITTKVWDTQQGVGKTQAALKQSLERLGMDYVDLYLVHWPVPAKTKETWQAMEDAQASGQIKSLGLSNFRQTDIEDLLTYAKIKPVYNQLELHPYLTQSKIQTFCHAHDIRVAAWSPLGSGSWSSASVEEKPVSDPVITALSRKYAVSAGQIILKWDEQKGRIVIPKAESETNIVNNLKLDGFELTPDEITQIDRLNKDHRFGGDPDTAYDHNITLPVP